MLLDALLTFIDWDKIERLLCRDLLEQLHAARKSPLKGSFSFSKMMDTMDWLHDAL